MLNWYTHEVNEQVDTSVSEFTSSRCIFASRCFS